MARRGIFKRGDTYWIRYASLDGMTIRESSRSPRFKDAEALLLQRKQAIKEGKMPETRRIGNHTFKQLIPEYLKWAERQRGCRNKTYIIGKLLRAFGNLPLRRFTPMLLEHYQTEKLQEETKPATETEPAKKTKPATVNRHMATLKHMFTKAVEWDMVEEAVAKRLSRVKLLPENNRRLRYLAKQECRDLIKKCDEHIRPIVITALNTGMRRGEILPLKWEQVDLKHGFILLDITKNGERREIPINQTLKEVFHSIPRSIAGGQENPYVFVNPDTDKPYTELKRSFYSACRRAGIKDFKFHDLRHTFASHLVMSGVDITTIKELLGHKTINMTLRYAHLAPSHKVKAVDDLDKALNERSTAQKLHNLALSHG